MDGVFFIQIGIGPLKKGTCSEQTCVCKGVQSLGNFKLKLYIPVGRHRKAETREKGGERRMPSSREE